MADFDSIVRIVKVFEFQLAKIHADVQTYDVKKVKMVHINSDRKLLVEYSSQLNEYVKQLGEAASDDTEVKTAGELCINLRKYIKDTSLRLDGFEEAISPPVKAIPAPRISTPQVKLPKLDLPTFDGKYEDWMSFRDRFTASIVKNSSLSGSERLEYLNSAVKGEAERLIKSFPITDSNFDEAWALLSKRYENNRELVFSLLKTFFSQPKLNSENFTSLRKLVDVSLQCQRSLAVLKRPVNQWDDMLVYTVVDKLDSNTKREWAKSLTGADMPTFVELVDFLENHIRGLHFSASKPSHNSGGSAARAAHHSSPNSKCPCCDQAHPLYSCSTFRALSPRERSSVVKSKHLCYNCLSSNHGVNACESKYTCKRCDKRHHSMLHFESAGGGENVKPPANPTGTPSPRAASAEANKQRSNEQSSSSSSQSNVASHYSGVNGILLATAEVEAQDSSGDFQTCRVFLDPGSESSFMTDKCATRLGLKKKKCNVKITGISSSSAGRASSTIHCNVRSRVRNFILNINALVLTKVTGDLPSFSTGGAQPWAHLQGLSPLADPQYLQPREVDILLGADVTERIFLDGRIVGGTSEPIARNSEFGWIIMGPVGKQHERSTSSFLSVRAHATTIEIDQTIKKFWEIEEVPYHPQLTEEEKFCENHFTMNHTRDHHGRYVVPLPYNNKLKELGSSRDMAQRRLLQLEKRFVKNPTYREEYAKFLREYEQLGHMQLIPSDQCGETVGVTNYLPHHFVLKEESSTTKLRVVFDGSAATSSGISFNNCLCVGPTIQEDLFSLLCRFRLHPIALKSDVAKMYRQFMVPPEDQDRQRILWRESPEQPIKEYRLSTVTYGTASAPFAATRCLQQLITDEGDNFPLAKQVASDSFYVDDLIGGAQSTPVAQAAQQELTHLMSKACLELRKWDSNDPNVLKNIDSSLVDRNGRFDHNDAITKALGVQWNSVNDTLLFSAYQPKSLTRITKRTLLSEMSKIFDPLGWLAPVTISIKCFFQELWMPVDTPDGSILLSWDDEIPQHLQPRWLQYQEDVSAIRLITIPRLCLPTGHIKIEIHGFSDASESAYCACVYLRSFFSDGSITSRLLTAKTKVAPLKFLSIPRMELCAALLLSRLISAVTTAIKLSAPIYAWTDSEITLRWLSSSSRRWKVFVANRVAEIHEILPAESWHFTPGEINPADCGTRGYKATDLVNCTLWWQGPTWMNSHGVPTFTCSNSLEGVEMEERPIKSLMVEVNSEFSLLQRFSCFSKLNRVTAYILRFMSNCRSRIQASRLNGELTVQELHHAYRCLIRMTQQEFDHEVSAITLGKGIRVSSKILALNPFLDADGILRVGGRLQRSPLEESNKHQILLPHNSPLTKLIIWHTHLKLQHGGFKLVITTLCRDFWILRGRNTIKQVLRSCILCKRLKAATAAQLMGSLPTDRVSPGIPFQKCGVDYAGPFTLQSRSGRGQKQFKGYFCVFVCFAVKSVHLEAVTDLSTAAFLAALKRFTARRGAPTDIYSDCGTNFTGADKELQQLVRSANHNHALFRVLAGEGIQWHFLPPSAPHQGGLWEAAVKSVKYHLRRIIGSTTVTFEEFSTILCQAEAVLNSRPLGPLSNNHEDYDVLTPAHFLIGRPITALPEPDHTHANVNRLSRWETCQQITQHLWKRWHLEYLNFLQERSKWRKEFPNVQVGDLVLIKEENCGPLQWKRGRIIATHPGPDGLVRAVTLKTRTGEFERPIVKICPLLQVD